MRAYVPAVRAPNLFIADITAPGASAESRKLSTNIFESYFEAYLDLYPTFATEIGDHRYDDQLEIAISDEHIAAQRRLFRAHPQPSRRYQTRTARYAPSGFYLEVLERDLRLGLDGQRFNSHLMPVRQLGSLAVEFPLLGSGTGIHPFRTVDRLRQFFETHRGI